MTYKLRRTQEAKEKREGLGTRFKTEIDAMLKYIKHHPQHFQVKYKDVREAVLKIFLDVIIYRIGLMRWFLCGVSNQ